MRLIFFHKIFGHKRLSFVNCLFVHLAHFLMSCSFLLYFCNSSSHSEDVRPLTVSYITDIFTALPLAFLKKICNTSWICVSSLHRGHANLFCIVPILVYVLLKWARLLNFVCIDVFNILDYKGIYHLCIFIMITIIPG